VQPLSSDARSEDTTKDLRWQTLAIVNTLLHPAFLGASPDGAPNLCGVLKNNTRHYFEQASQIRQLQYVPPCSNMNIFTLGTKLAFQKYFSLASHDVTRSNVYAKLVHT
jgi:hypothetical protein